MIALNARAAHKMLTTLSLQLAMALKMVLTTGLLKTHGLSGGERTDTSAW